MTNPHAPAGEVTHMTNDDYTARTGFLCTPGNSSVRLARAGLTWTTDKTQVDCPLCLVRLP